MSKLGLLSLLLITIFVSSAWSADLIVVPPGNRNATIPEFPEVVMSRVSSQMVTNRGRTDTVDSVLNKNFKSILSYMKSDLGHDPSVLGELLKASELYGVDPVAVLGCIVGEHVFNVKIHMEMQDLALRSIKATAAWTGRFYENNVDLAQILKTDAFAECDANGSQYNYWICVQSTWNGDVRGSTINGQRMPDTLLRKTFFNPAGFGYTYGLGQLDPMRALMVSDIIHEVSGLKKISIDDATGVYDAILDPYATVHYIAANVKMISDTFARKSGFDISQNPGVIATLYNMGYEWDRASKRRKEDKRSLEKTGEHDYPEENFYGWYINKREDDLRKFLEDAR